MINVNVNVNEINPVNFADLIIYLVLDQFEGPKINAADATLKCNLVRHSSGCTIYKPHRNFYGATYSWP